MTKGKNTTVLSRDALLALVTWIKNHEHCGKDSQTHQNSSTSVEQGPFYSPEKTCCQSDGITAAQKVARDAKEGVEK